MPHEARAPGRALGAAWLFGLLVLAAVISTVIARGEITGVTRALRHVQVSWLLAGIGLQAATYILAAGIWRVALARQGERRSLAMLVPLSLAMLFSNQAVPSVGLSGGLVVQEALARRGTSRPAAMAALLMGLITTYGALVIALAGAALRVVRGMGLREAAQGGEAPVEGRDASRRMAGRGHPVPGRRAVDDQAESGQDRQERARLARVQSGERGGRREGLQSRHRRGSPSGRRRDGRPLPQNPQDGGWAHGLGERQRTQIAQMGLQNYLARQTKGATG